MSNILLSHLRAKHTKGENGDIAHGAGKLIRFIPRLLPKVILGGHLNFSTQIISFLVCGEPLCVLISSTLSDPV
jgi:hypothetical protein